MCLAHVSRNKLWSVAHNVTYVHMYTYIGTYVSCFFSYLICISIVKANVHHVCLHSMYKISTAIREPLPTFVRWAYLSWIDALFANCEMPRQKLLQWTDKRSLQPLRWWIRPCANLASKWNGLQSSQESDFCQCLQVSRKNSFLKNCKRSFLKEFHTTFCCLSQTNQMNS